jgi:hypothetical protein
MVRIPFFFFWHLTRGKIPTARGSWKGYSYPIAVDGEKVTKKLGYEYQHEGFDAFYYTDGAYEYSVPPSRAARGANQMIVDGRRIAKEILAQVKREAESLSAPVVRAITVAPSAATSRIFHQEKRAGRTPA